MTAETDFALSELKALLDAAFIELSVKHGLDEGNLTGVREAADKLFAASLRRKFHSLTHEPTEWRDKVDREALEGFVDTRLLAR